MVFEPGSSLSAFPRFMYSLPPSCHAIRVGSFRCERLVEGLQERRIAERLHQAFDGAALLQVSSNRLVPMGGDEDDRDLHAAVGEHPLQIEAGHSWHGDVQYQAMG